VSISDLPRITLKSRRAMPFFCRHPWVFTGAVAKVEGDPAPGAEVAVFSHEKRFIARGLYNPHSKIRVRLYQWDEKAPIDEAFWSEQIDQAIAWRRRLYPNPDEHAAFRLIFSEGDHLSGLIVDQYGPWLAAQFTSLALAQRSQMLVGLLQEKLQPRGIWIRNDKEMNKNEGIAEPLESIGEEPPRPLLVKEDDLTYEVDVVGGQKTGFYIDQRENRRLVASYAVGGDLLDMFCYTGGFGLTAAKQGAKSVLGVDSSEPAIAAARINAERNGLTDKIQFEQGDAFRKFEELVEQGRSFDTVVLDPPRMTRSASGRTKAMRGYYRLNQLATKLLPAGGVLVTCSCSGLVSKADFQGMLADVALHSNRSLQILEARGAAADHPVSTRCPESDYLKCYVCRVV